MVLDSIVIAFLIYVFAQSNASGGILRSFLMLAVVIGLSLVAMVYLPESLRILVVPLYLLLLAAGLTFICGTQPRQTGKIIGCFLIYRVLWALGVYILVKATS